VTAGRGDTAVQSRGADRGIEYDRTLAVLDVRVVGGSGPTDPADWPALTVDGVHPNPRGHERIADVSHPGWCPRSDADYSPNPSRLV